MEQTVRSFNKLSRPKQTPSGLPNHWVFGVCRVNFVPGGDVVMAVHLPSTRLLFGGPAPIISFGGGPEEAEATISCLLQAFVRGDVNPQSRQPTDPPPFAPWTWSTPDPAIAKAVENGLRNHGISPELCRVGICSVQEQYILETAGEVHFLNVFEKMLPGQLRELPPVDQGDSTRCHGCRMGCENFPQPLKSCAGCNKVFYHSKDCQKKHWKLHKPTCLPHANFLGLDASTYYDTKARSDPGAQALMRSLNLDPRPPYGGTAQVFPCTLR